MHARHAVVVYPLCALCGLANDRPHYRCCVVCSGVRVGRPPKVARPDQRRRLHRWEHKPVVLPMVARCLMCSREREIPATVRLGTLLACSYCGARMLCEVLG